MIRRFKRINRYLRKRELGLPPGNGFESLFQILKTRVNPFRHGKVLLLA